MKMRTLVAMMATTLALVACGENKRSDSRNKGASDETTKVVAQTVSNDERKKASDIMLFVNKRIAVLETQTPDSEELQALKAQRVQVQGKLIAPTLEDELEFSDFLAANKDHGLARIFPFSNGKNPRHPNLLAGNGSRFNFLSRSHEPSEYVDIEYQAESQTQRPQFWPGTNAAYGAIVQLSLCPDFSKFDTLDPSVQAALGLASPTTNSTQKEWQEFFAQTRNGNNTKRSGMPILPELGSTYALRAVYSNGRDVVVTFKVVRRDEVDGSLVIAFKILTKLKLPDQPDHSPRLACASAKATDYYKCQGANVSLNISASSRTETGGYVIEFAETKERLSYSDCIRREDHLSFGTTISLLCRESIANSSVLTLYPYHFGMTNVAGGQVEISGKSRRSINLSCDVSPGPVR